MGMLVADQARTGWYPREIVGAPPPGDLYLDEPWVSIRWDDAHHCVYTEWKAFANSAEFRAALMTALDAIKETGSSRAISVTPERSRSSFTQIRPGRTRSGFHFSSVPGGETLCTGNSGGWAGQGDGRGRDQAGRQPRAADEGICFSEPGLENGSRSSSPRQNKAPRGLVREARRKKERCLPGANHSSVGQRSERMCFYASEVVLRRLLAR